jgi:hypothetical protein
MTSWSTAPFLPFCLFGWPWRVLLCVSLSFLACFWCTLLNNDSVEHLSKWWKVLDFDFGAPLVWNVVADKLGTYIKNGAKDYPAPSQDPPVFVKTFATIAFQPYKASGKNKIKELPMARAYNTTVVSLAATIESLRRAEMGRSWICTIRRQGSKDNDNAAEYAPGIPSWRP